MPKRKRKGSQNEPNIKKIRSEVIDFSFNNSVPYGSEITQSLTNTPRNVQSRKERRKEERLLKKARKQAFSQRKAIPTKQDLMKAKELIAQDEHKEMQLKKKKAQRKKEKKEKKKWKERKKRKIEENKQKEAAEMDAVKMRDNREIRDLEKKLHLNKRKSKTLPQSFLDDGLDYILDIVDSDKLEALANTGEESDLEDEFKGTTEEMGEDLDEFGSDLDEEADGFDMEEEEEEEEEEEGEEIDDDDDDDDDLDDGLMDINKETINDASEEIKDEDIAIENKDKKEKWEKLAERIQQVVNKNTKKSKGIIKPSAISDENLDNRSKDTKAENTKVKKKVSFAEETAEKTVESDHSSSLENSFTDSDSIVSGESNEDMNETGDNLDNTEIKEDIYGRLRDSKGNIVKDNKGAAVTSTGAYVPPAKRAQMIGGADEKRQAQLDKLRKQMKGLVNRASEANLQSVSSQLEELYLSNSRADVNETLVSLVFDLCVTMEMTPERLSMELMMLVAILHGNVGSEVGAHFLQNLVKKFDDMSKGQGQLVGKEIDNVVVLLSHLYNFKVVHSVLMFDVLKLLTDRFQEKDVELILLIVKNIGFSLRKDNPAGLKELISNIQTRASSPEVSMLRDQSRIRFMLDIVMAIRNNNMRKIPNYDPEHLHHLQKSMKGFLRGGDVGDNQLHVTLQDLINAENKGKWWIVGSAWEGQGPKQPLKENPTDTSFILHGIEISSKLQELAKKQRMNTDKRRTIFYVIMTSEDYIDAFEKLLRMGLKANQQQEIIIVILDCCLQEKSYNPFYAFLAQKFCEHHRSYQMSFQFSIWDRFKEVGDLSETNRHNFGKLLTHLIINKALSLSILKVVQFGAVQKSMVRLLKQIITEILMDPSQDRMEAVFGRIAPLVKLKKLHEGLKLFMHHFLIGRKKEGQEVDPVLKERVDIVGQLLSASKGHML